MSNLKEPSNTVDKLSSNIRNFQNADNQRSSEHNKQIICISMLNDMITGLHSSVSALQSRQGDCNKLKADKPSKFIGKAQ